jgi:hypothetical protein
MLAFGPDGLLYVGIGDGGGANDPENNAQNVDTLLGKLLRIDIDVAPEVTYISPAGNPFVGATAGRDEIFVYGMRNPWRFSFDRGGTNQLWVGDVFSRDLRARRRLVVGAARHRDANLIVRRRRARRSLRRRSQRRREPDLQASEHVHVCGLTDARHLSRVSRRRNNQRDDAARMHLGGEQ